MAKKGSVTIHFGNVDETEPALQTPFKPSASSSSALAPAFCGPYPTLPHSFNVGFSWGLLGSKMTDGDVLDAFMEETKEHFIMKNNIQIITGEGAAAKMKNRCVVLTEESWIELKSAERCEPPTLPSPLSDPTFVTTSKEKKHKSLLEIHSVEIDPTTPTIFRIYFFSGSASSKAKAGFSKMKRLFSVNSSFDDFLKSKTIKCHSPEECSQWLLVLEKLCRNCWQRKLEKDVLVDPEYYKRHAFVIKQHNDRLLLLSNEWFYNIEASYKPIVIKSIKWCIPVSSFVSVTQAPPSSDLAIMTISFDAAEAKKQSESQRRSNKKEDLKNKHHEFVFCTAAERQKFVNSLSAVYWQVTRKKLEVK